MTKAISEEAKACPVGSCQRHGECMYLNHPRCPAKAIAKRGGKITFE